MSADPYDITLSIGATTYGFMLVTPAGATKQLEWREVGPPEAQRVSTADVATHQDYPPDKDVPFAMSNFSGGAGKLEFEIDDEDTYWWGVCVSHMAGKVCLPPPTTQKTLGSAAANVGGFTTYQDPSTGTRYDFCWAGTRLYRRTADASTAWTLLYAQPNSKVITDFRVVNGFGLIAVPTLTNAIGGDFYYQADVTAAATWTPTLTNHAAFTDAAGRPKKFIQNRATVYAMVDNRKIFFSTDPTADSWVGPIDVDVSGNFAGMPGDNTYPFQAAAAVGDYLMVFKQDAGYSVDSQQEVAEIFWQWKQRPSSKNFEFVSAGGDAFWLTAGNDAHGYDPTNGRTVDLNASMRSGFALKAIHGMAADNRFVYMLAQVRVSRLRSADSEALLRFYQTGPKSWGVECLWEDTALGSDIYYNLAVFPDGAASRVYWGHFDGASTYETFHMGIPAEWDESTSGSYATSGTLYTSIAKSGFPGLKKLHLWVSTLARNLSATYTMAVAYSTDEGASFTALATLTSDEVLTSFADVTSKSIVLRFTFSSDGADTPVLRSFDHHQRPRFRYLPSGMATIRVADHIEMNNGALADEDKTTLVSNLETLRANEGSNWIAYQDVFGRAFDITLDALTFKVTHHEVPQDQYEQEAVILMTRADSGS